MWLVALLAGMVGFCLGFLFACFDGGAEQAQRDMAFNAGYAQGYATAVEEGTARRALRGLPLTRDDDAG